MVEEMYGAKLAPLSDSYHAEVIVLPMQVGEPAKEDYNPSLNVTGYMHPDNVELLGFLANPKICMTGKFEFQIRNSPEPGFKPVQVIILSPNRGELVDEDQYQLGVRYFCLTLGRNADM